jgi:hypothetical protein
MRFDAIPLSKNAATLIRWLPFLQFSDPPPLAIQSTHGSSVLEMGERDGQSISRISGRCLTKT